MVDINRKSGNMRDRTLDDNDEGYDPNSYDSDPFAPEPKHEKDYSKSYKGRPEVIKVEGIIIRETDSALLFKFQLPECNAQTEWFPLSQIKSIVRSAGKKDEVTMSAWIANKKGISE